MIENMATCSKCGLELPLNAPEGNCPNCNLRSAVGDPETIAGYNEGGSLAAFSTVRRLKSNFLSIT